MIIEEMVLNEVLSGEAGAGNPVSMAPDVKSATRAKSVELANRHAKDAASKTSISISAAKKEIDDLSPEDKKAYLKGFGTDPSTKGAKDPKEGFSDCMVIMQMKSGSYERILPAETGKLDCSPSSITPVTLDPVVEAQSIQ